MNVLIPVAGIGKRLRPHTYSIPKSLLVVGDKPIIGHILDRILRVCDSPPRKVIFIVGYMGDKLMEYVRANYAFESVYIEQKEPLGLGHAVWLARDLIVDEPCLIIYGDTIFDSSVPMHSDIDGYIGVKEVADPSRFGIVEVESGFIKKFVEKPASPVSNLALVGVNFINSSSLLLSHLGLIINRGKKTAGEFQLTDAFESMLEAGCKFKPFFIDKWYDCGTFDSLLYTNRELLSGIRHKVSGIRYNGATINEPVFIHELAKIENSIIGPNVSVGKDSYIKDSIIFDSIINEGALIENSRLEHSIIGVAGVVKEVSGRVNIGCFSEVIGSIK